MKQFIHSRFPKTVGLVLALSVGMVACGTTSTPTPVEQNMVTGVSISNTGPLALQTGSTNNTAQIMHSVTGTGTFNSAVMFSSDKETVATVDANGLVTARGVGTAIITVATVMGGKTATITVNVTAGTTPTPAVDVKINFQRDDFATPDTFVKNIGAAFDGTSGWITEATARTGTPAPLDLRGNTRTRTVAGFSPEENSLIHLQYIGTAEGSVTTPGAFLYKLPEGNYTVTVSVGDATAASSLPPFDSEHTVNIEGTTAINKFKPSNAKLFETGFANVQVTDGFLTIDAIGGTNTKINYITIKSNTSAAQGQ